MEKPAPNVGSRKLAIKKAILGVLATTVTEIDHIKCGTVTRCGANAELRRAADEL